MIHVENKKYLAFFGEMPTRRDISCFKSQKKRFEDEMNENWNGTEKKKRKDFTLIIGNTSMVSIKSMRLLIGGIYLKNKLFMMKKKYLINF